MPDISRLTYDDIHLLRRNGKTEELNRLLCLYRKYRLQEKKKIQLEISQSARDMKYHLGFCTADGCFEYHRDGKSLCLTCSFNQSSYRKKKNGKN